MTRILTQEQLAIVAAARDTQDNLLIEALAGAAKTTTLTELAAVLRGSVLCIAFNKKIATEMSERMPSHVQCKTLNALGHSIWGSKLKKRLVLADDKCRYALNDAIAELEDAEKEEAYEHFSDIMNYIRGAKNHGHVPDYWANKLGDNCKPLLSDAELIDLLPEDMTNTQWQLVRRVLISSFGDALEGRIDFADQLLMPTVMKCMFPAFQNVLVDEAQDLSELNHVMLSKLVKGRIIAVGDSKQAIYAFRGAHTEGMPLLATRFDMRVLHLSTTFRCPQAVCDHVRWHVPRIQAWEGNPANPGLVEVHESFPIDQIEDGSAVICRNNAPLFTMAIRILRSGRRPKVWGNDVVAALVKTMEKFGPSTMRRADAQVALQAWHRERMAKLKRESSKAAQFDRMECIRVFIDDAETLGGAINFAKVVLSSPGSIDLCSGHKSKGNEWDKVYILDRHLLKDNDQEHNLAYVMATRAKKHLAYIQSDGII